jgi:hypothetical protein
MEIGTIVEIIDKLVGKVEPVGETHVDNKRFENLQKLCGILDHYSVVVSDVSNLKNRQEYSIKRSGEFAENFKKETVDYFNS